MWASWCQPSLSTFKNLEELSHLNEKVKFVGLNLDESNDQASKVIKDNSWDISHIQQLSIYKSSCDLELGGRNIPRIILVDKQGKIAYIGHPKNIDIKSSIETLLND